MSDLRLFCCPTYRAKITMAACAMNRAKPLVTDSLKPGSAENLASFRHPNCTDACPALLTMQAGGLEVWELLKQRCKVGTQYDLADKLGTHQTKISQTVQKLRKGITPTGDVWNAMLKLSGLTPEVLLYAAKSERAKAAMEERVDPGPGSAESAPLATHEEKEEEHREHIDTILALNACGDGPKSPRIEDADVPLLLGELARRMPGWTITITGSAPPAALA